jgi:amidohydrolase
MKLIDPILALADEFKQVRRDIHAHPELCFNEHRTAEVVAKKLESFGLQVHRGLGTTGVVGVLRGALGKSTRAVGIRADMDALPLQEHNEFAHRSQFEGKMHACGHDGHTAILLAAAKYLSLHPNFDGTVNFIFQPAEEGGGGAREMIKDGLFEKFPCDAVYALHNWPGFPIGTMGVRAGAQMASSNEFYITVTGKGCHAALPHDGNDPIMATVAIAQALQTIVTRNKKPIDTAVLSVTQIHAGSATNIVPDDAKIVGTVRTFDTKVTDLVEKRMREIADLTARAFNCEASVEFHRNYPATVNDPAEAAFCAKVMTDIVGADSVFSDVEPVMGSEDFSYMLEVKRGAYVFMGNGDGSHREHGHGLGPCSLHNPNYDFNDELIPIGATYWARLVEQFFART